MVFRIVLLISTVMILLSVLAGNHDNIKLLVVALIGLLASYEDRWRY